MNTKYSDIAIIGMAGKFPGANSVSRFWENICEGKESICPLSDDELRKAGVPDSDIKDNAYVKVSPVLEDIDKFDQAFFKVPPVEAELMDPQIRLLLQCAWHTLEDAGYATKNPQNIGVYTGAGGITTSYYTNFINKNSQFEKSTAGPTHLGNDKDFLSTYISYKLNLTGPSMTIQTACSTSLVALHKAILSLLNDECDMALTGGVSIRIPHIQGYHYKEGHIFSRSGHVKTFDANADGVVFGSGLGLVLIKRLENAIKDKDHIYAVVKGSSIANDGRAKLSYAASSAKGQIRCIRNALDKAGVDAGTIGFVESHGTGTFTGDPEEVKALSVAFKSQTDKKNYCALGAVKSNVGHLEAASGITALIKAVLALRYGVIPPTLHFNKPNPRIKFEKTPFFVNNKLMKWEANGEPRRAGVNNLGIGGTNAFVILEEYITEKNLPGPVAHPVIVPVSAKTDNSLRCFVRKLSEFIETSGTEAINISDLSYTLQVGRDAMECRVAFMASSLTALKNSLNLFLEDKEDESHGIIREDEQKSIKNLYDDDDDSDKVVQELIRSQQWRKLAELWVTGRDINWNRLYNDIKPQRISLPTYVFEKERYWIDGQSATEVVTSPILHPLLHTNTSDFDQQSYSAVFSGEEFFLRDHQIKIDGTSQQKVLPGVAYLEMVRASVAFSLPDQPASEILELCDILWLKPFVVNHHKQASIVLFEDDRRDRIDFEIYSLDKDNEGDPRDVVHCQGYAKFGRKPVNPKLDLDRLRGQMKQGSTEASGLYEILAGSGLNYGPAHRGITSVLFGEGQLIAQLCLPSVFETSVADEHINGYVLHPSLMDSALQSSIGLIADLNHPPGKPSLPFVLETLRIISPCTKEMVAWVRHSRGSKPEDKVVKLDIDLCDTEGNICVQMLGFTSRIPKASHLPVHQETLNGAIANDNDMADNDLYFDEAFYQNLIEKFLNKEISIDEILELV